MGLYIRLFVCLLNYFEVSWQGLQLGWPYIWYDLGNCIAGAKHFHSGIDSSDTFVCKKREMNDLGICNPKWGLLR